MEQEVMNRWAIDAIKRVVEAVKNRFVKECKIDFTYWLFFADLSMKRVVVSPEGNVDVNLDKAISKIRKMEPIVTIVTVPAVTVRDAGEDFDALLYKALTDLQTLSKTHEIGLMMTMLANGGSSMIAPCIFSDSGRSVGEFVRAEYLHNHGSAGISVVEMPSQPLQHASFTGAVGEA